MVAPTVATPAGRVPLIPLILAGAGLYLAWFAVHYWSSANVVWPTTPVKDVLTGKGIPANKVVDPAAGIDAGLKAQAPGAAGNAPAVHGAYTLAELEALWTSQGGAAATAAVAANVAMAESSGNPGASSGNPDGGQNIGLWQLDTRGVGAGYTAAQLADPATNARITVLATANGTNWSRWADSVVQNGVYVGPRG
jgi:hypothetical protein